MDLKCFLLTLIVVRSLAQCQQDDQVGCQSGNEQTDSATLLQIKTLQAELDEENEFAREIEDESTALTGCPAWCKKGKLRGGKRSETLGWLTPVAGQKVPKCAWSKCVDCSECAALPSKNEPWCSSPDAMAKKAKACAWEGCKESPLCGGPPVSGGFLDEDEAELDELNEEDEFARELELESTALTGCPAWCKKGKLRGGKRSETLGWLTPVAGQKVPKCAWSKCVDCSECAALPSKNEPWCSSPDAMAKKAKACAWEGCKESPLCGGPPVSGGFLDEDEAELDELNEEDEFARELELESTALTGCPAWCKKGKLRGGKRSETLGWLTPVAGQKVPKCAWSKCVDCSQCAALPSKNEPWCSSSDAMAKKAKACAWEGCKESPLCGGPPVSGGFLEEEESDYDQA